MIASVGLSFLSRNSALVVRHATASIVYHLTLDRKSDRLDAFFSAVFPSRNCASIKASMALRHWTTRPFGGSYALHCACRYSTLGKFDYRW